MNNWRQSIKSNGWIELAARWILGLTFIYASFHKIVSPADFAKIVYGYNLFPEISINLIAIVIPFLELVIGLALIIGIYPRSAAIIISGLLLVFIAASAINLIRGHEFNCGCFSGVQDGYASSPELTIARNIFYLALGMQIALFKGKRRSCFGRLIFRQ